MIPVSYTPFDFLSHPSPVIISAINSHLEKITLAKMQSGNSLTIYFFNNLGIRKISFLNVRICIQTVSDGRQMIADGFRNC